MFRLFPIWGRFVIVIVMKPQTHNVPNIVRNIYVPFHIKNCFDVNYPPQTPQMVANERTMREWRVRNVMACTSTRVCLCSMSCFGVFGVLIGAVVSVRGTRNAPWPESIWLWSLNPSRVFAACAHLIVCICCLWHPSWFAQQSSRVSSRPLDGKLERPPLRVESEEQSS